MCCCGFFQSEDFSDFPIIDGISIQKSSRKSVKLGIDEFEAKILQPASVLWINRIPSEELIANGKIFDIYVSPQAILPNGFSKTVAISIAEGIHTFTEIGVCNSLKRTDENRLIIKKFLCDLKEIVSKYSSYPFAMELEEELQEMQENINNRSFLADKDTIEYISFVGTTFKAVIAKYRLEFEEQFSRTRKGLTAITLESFERETNSNISVFLRNLRQSQKKAKEEEFTLYSYFERAWKTFEKIDTVHNLKKCNIEKIAYLSASFRVFAFECLPPKINISIRKKMCERVDLALINMTMRQIKGSNAKTILEQHILQLIKHNRIARIRGKQSAEGNIAIWFDSQSDTFLLPMDTYFEELRETANLEISQRQFENMLEKDGVIYTVLNKNSSGQQKRRSFTVILRASGKRERTLKIPLIKLSSDFRKDKDVEVAIEKMKKDKSSLRTTRCKSV